MNLLRLKLTVSVNVDNIYLMSTFPETIPCYLKKSFIIDIYEEFG